jgi:hypothetical protein
MSFYITKFAERANELSMLNDYFQNIMLFLFFLGNGLI